MWQLLKITHDDMHGFVAHGRSAISFRDPFVFLLHSNVDRLYAMWQTAPGHADRLDANTVYGTDGISRRSWTARSALERHLRQDRGRHQKTSKWQRATRTVGRQTALL